MYQGVDVPEGSSGPWNSQEVLPKHFYMCAERISHKSRDEERMHNRQAGALELKGKGINKDRGSVTAQFTNSVYQLYNLGQFS